ncbi:MAG TPA: alpha/beta hydrolase, partial [Sphingomicrobium sp.]|nr:alpha/beta hydrolase [Sphingomicrobium sp.]
VTLNVALAGDRAKPAVILLHGFPESHRTWRDVAPMLARGFFVIMPDQRGFAGSDLPQDVSAYKTDCLIDDLFALAGALDLAQFSLVGHDWGGAIAWGAALRADPRLDRLAIVNAPHPVIFQKSLIEDEEQRSASQYINAFRTPGFEQYVEAKGFEWFFNATFARHTDVRKIPEAERRQYIADWSQPGAFNAMLNWYRAANVIVPPPGIAAPVPEFLLRLFPTVDIPTLVIWAMNDAALLPVQLEGLDRLVRDLSIIRLADVGHFAPWESPGRIVAALMPFLERQPAARASAQ